MNYRGKGGVYETEEATQWAISREGKKYIHIVKRRICETGRVQSSQCYHLFIVPLSTFAGNFIKIFSSYFANR